MTIYLNDDCSSLSAWTDMDTGGAATTQVTFDGRSTIKQLCSAAAPDNVAQIKRNVGALPNKLNINITIYPSLIGTAGANDAFMLQARWADMRLAIKFASDGLFVHDGTAYNKIGSLTITPGQWTTWAFVVDKTIPTSAVCYIYQDGVKVASNVDCSYTGTNTDGDVYLLQFGFSVSNALTYIDSLLIKDGFDISGVIQKAGVFAARKYSIIKESDGSPIATGTCLAGDGTYFENLASQDKVYVIAEDIDGTPEIFGGIIPV